MKKLLLSATVFFFIANPDAEAQVNNSMLKVNKIFKSLLLRNALKTDADGMNFDGLNVNTTKASRTTTYLYYNGNWNKQLSTKKEYNTKGYTTVTETQSEKEYTKLENTYDDILEGFVTKTTSYTWDKATSTWINPIVISQVDLTRDKKGRVTKKITYAYDEDTKELVKEAEVNYGYSIITGQMNSIKMTISEEEEGTETNIPMTITIQKWHNYNANKLFDYSIDDFGANNINDKDNQIESGTVTMTIGNIPFTGTIKGEYTDTSSSFTFDIISMMSINSKMNITDSYGSSETTISMDMAGTNIMSSTIKNTNNEHGDCIRTESTGTTNSDSDLFNVYSDFDDSDIDTDLNQTLTYDYEYYTLPDNNVMRKSMVMNILDKTSNEFKPTTKTTYDEYTDYVSKATGINSIKNAGNGQINGIYSINGYKLDKLPNSTSRSVYIIKESGKTKKVIK